MTLTIDSGVDPSFPALVTIDVIRADITVASVSYRGADVEAGAPVALEGHGLEGPLEASDWPRYPGWLSRSWQESGKEGLAMHASPEPPTSLSRVLPLRFRPLTPYVLVVVGLGVVGLLVAVFIGAALDDGLSELGDDLGGLVGALVVGGGLIAVGVVWARRAPVELSRSSEGLVWRGGRGRVTYVFPGAAVRGVWVNWRSMGRHASWEILLEVSAEGVPGRLRLARCGHTGARYLVRASRLAQALDVPFVDPMGQRWRRSRLLFNRWLGEGRSWLLILVVLLVGGAVLAGVLLRPTSLSEAAIPGALLLVALAVVQLGRRPLPLLASSEEGGGAARAAPAGEGRLEARAPATGRAERPATLVVYAVRRASDAPDAETPVVRLPGTPREALFADVVPYWTEMSAGDLLAAVEEPGGRPDPTVVSALRAFAREYPERCFLVAWDAGDGRRGGAACRG